MKRYLLEHIIYSVSGDLGDTQYVCDGCTIVDSASSIRYFMDKDKAEKYVSKLVKINLTTVNKCISYYGEKITDIELDKYEKLDDSISDDTIYNIAKNSELCGIVNIHDYMIIMLHFLVGLAVFEIAAKIAQPLIYTSSMWISLMGIVVMLVGGMVGCTILLNGE